jgi:dihydrofolate reductase
MSGASDRKVMLFIAMSVDGYIAKPDGDISFLSVAEKPGEDYGYGDFIQQIDTVIMGRKTYDKVKGIGIPWPHADKQAYIITRSIVPSSENIIFYNGSPERLVNALKEKAGLNIFVDGGSEIINELFEYNLIDEMIIFTLPVLIGDGIPMFRKGIPEIPLELIRTKQYDTGVVEMHYKRKP